MIWHVIKKDLRTLWWLGPILVVSAMGYAYSFHFRMAPINGLPVGLVMVWPYLACALALARMVQVETPASARGDWHTRPLSRWTVLVAKAIVAVVGVLLPWAAIDFGWSVAWGIEPGLALVGALAHMTLIALGLTLVMAVAAATRSTIQFLLLTAGLGAALIFGLGMSLQLLLGPPQPLVAGIYASDGFFVALGATSLILLLAALALLYHRRRVTRAWGVIIGATLGIEFAGLLASTILAAHWPPLTKPEPAEASGLTIAANGPATSSGHVIPYRRGAIFTPVNLPLGIQMASAVTAEIDRVLINQTWSDGRSLDVAVGRGGGLGSNLVLNRYFAAYSEPERAEVRYRLRVRKTLPSITMTGDGPLALPGGGSCRVVGGGAQPENGDRAALRCVSGSPLCLSVTITDNKPHGHYVSGCALTSSLSGRYEQGTSYLPSGRPLSITRYIEVGLVDRGFSTGWFTPVITPDPPPRPRPSPPVNAN